MKKILMFLLIGLLVWPYATKKESSTRIYFNFAEYDHEKHGCQFVSYEGLDTLSYANGSVYLMLHSGYLKIPCQNCNKDTTVFNGLRMLEIKEPDKISML